MTDQGQAQFVPHSHFPYGKEGAGFYSENAPGSFDVVSLAQPLVLSALDRLPIQEGSPLYICDYGAADGGTSIVLLGTCISEIKKKHGQEKEIIVFYEDQPCNDFKSVINRINGLIPGPPSYVRKNKGVYTACVGTDFFSKCFPANSIHLGVSFTAMQWLSDRPCTLSDAVHHMGSSEMEKIKCFQKQAEQDWETILLARAYELVPGGQMVIACLAVNEEGQFSGTTKRARNGIYERLTTHWAAMVTEGKITQDEFANATLYNYIRTVGEFSTPFEDPQSKVRQAGLHLVSIETQIVPCRHHCAWEASDKKDDPETAKTYARRFIRSIRPWSNSTFRTALNSSRTEDEKDRIVDEFFTHYEADVASAPGDHAADLVHAYLHIQKSTRSNKI